MKGLLIKDFLVILKQFRFSAIAIGLWMILGMFFDAAQYQIFIPLFCTTLVTSCVANDETSCFQKYMEILPVNRKQIVSEKYVLAIILATIGLALFLGLSATEMLLAGTFEFKSLILTGVLSVVASLFLPALSIPLFLHWGVAKGRIIYMIFISALGIGIVTVLNDFYYNLAELPHPAVTLIKCFSHPATVAAIGIAGVAVLLLISWAIAVKLYQSKEA